MLEAAKRVLLVEFVNADQFPGQIHASLPFLKGYCHHARKPVRWLRYGIAATNFLRHGRDAVTLTDAELARLLAVARELRPDLLATTHPLYEEHVAALCAEVPGCETAIASALRFPLTPALGPEQANGYLAALDVPDFAPDYAWEPANEEGARPDRHNVYVLLSEACGYKAAVTDNPCYAGLALPDSVRPFGCAFEGHERHGGRCRQAVATPARLVARQLRAMAESLGPERRPNALLFENLEGSGLLRRVLDELRACGLAGVPLLFGVRMDRLVAMGEVLREVLGSSEDGDAALHVFVCGLENFAADELLRMNKGTTPLVNMRGLNLLAELEHAFPRRFHYSAYKGLSVILLTPWTTLAELHLNVRLIEHFRIEGEIGNLFICRLRLHPDVAMTYLAERDGLLADDEADDVLRHNRRKLFREEAPWRAREPRLEPLARVVARLEPDRAFENDPLATRMLSGQRARWRAAGMESPATEWDRTARIRLFRALVDVARRDPGPVADEDLLEAAFALFEARAAEAAVRARAPCVRRLGEERVPLAVLVERLVALLGPGPDALPVLVVRGLLPDEVARLPLDALAAAGLHARVRADGGPAERAHLFVARAEAALEARLALEGPLGGPSVPGAAEAAREAARLQGLPDCCAEAWAARPSAAWSVPARWAVLGTRLATDGPAAAAPLLVPELAFVPCHPGCLAAAARFAAWHRTLGIVPPPSSRAFLFPLGEDAEDELVGVDVTSREPDGLRYDPASVADGPGTIRTQLAAADRLRLVPGQVQVWQGDTLRELWTADVGLWDPVRRYDGDEWTELLRAVARQHDPEDQARAARAAAIAPEVVADRRILLRSPPPMPRTAVPSGPAPFAERPDTLRVAFSDRLGRHPGFTFLVGPAGSDDLVFQRIGATGIAHLPCPNDRAFTLCVAVLGAAARAVGRPPQRESLALWQAAIARVVERTALPRRFDCHVT